MRDNGGRDLRIDHYQFLKVSFGKAELTLI